MKTSIDVSIRPPSQHYDYFTISTHGDKYYSIAANSEVVSKLLTKMFDIRYEVRKYTIAIHGWIPGPAKR